MAPEPILQIVYDAKRNRTTHALLNTRDHRCGAGPADISCERPSENVSCDRLCPWCAPKGWDCTLVGTLRRSESFPIFAHERVAFERVVARSALWAEAISMAVGPWRSRFLRRGVNMAESISAVAKLAESIFKDVMSLNFYKAKSLKRLRASGERMPNGRGGSTPAATSRRDRIL